jgi:iron complex transport system ATP-binding protein
MTDIAYLQHRKLDELSGGERQRAWIALPLAQATPVILLDEPTTYLDIRHQLEVLHLVRRLNRECGKTIVVVLHDLNQAASYATRMIAMHAGRVVADGTPEQVLTTQLLGDVFGVRAEIVALPGTGTRVCVPLETTARQPPTLSAVGVPAA